MSDLKTERQLNLLFVLLNTNFPIEREEIRRRVPGYFNKSNEAFERMFERDKEDLRDLGIPIEAVTTDVLHEDVFGYVLKKDEWLMPELSLTPQERALLNVAASAWATAQSNATSIGGALNKAVERLVPRDQSPTNLEVSLATNGQKIEAILQAQSQMKCVEFRYFNPKRNAEEFRLIAPWRIFMRQGNTYLIGFDQSKGEQRTFRLSRIYGQVLVSSEDAIEPMPADINVEQIVASWEVLQSNVANVQLEIERDMAGDLRLLASDVEIGETHDLITIDNVDQELLVQAILKNCDRVRVISPTEICEIVTERLSELVYSEK